MTAICHPATTAVAQDMPAGVVLAICERPGDTPVQREALTHSVVHSVMAFEPRDPVEIMFAGMVVTHFHLILHCAHDAFHEAPRDGKGRGKATIVALDRSMVGFAKELRAAQTRPMEEGHEAASRVAPAEPVAKSASKSQAESRRPPASAPSPRQAAPVADWRSAAPVPLLQPLRPHETSEAALLAVLSPPTKPRAPDLVSTQDNR
jgi:hypothetical protein